MIRLRTFGAPDLEADGGRERVTLLHRPKAFALLVYLASEGRILHQRDSLLAMFWPEADDEHARNCLRQSLHELRQCLGDQVIRTEGRCLVGVDPHALNSDVREFRTALGANQPETALALYGGDFLDGFFIRGAPEFEHWVELRRASYRDLAVRAAWTLADKAARQGRSIEARRWLYRLGELSPNDDLIVRRPIQVVGRADPLRRQ